MAKQIPQNNTLLYEFMHDYGVTPRDITYNVKEYKAFNSYKPHKLFNCDRKRGDLEITYLTLDERLAEHNEKGTPQITYRKRLANPYNNTSGSLVKYLMVGKNVIYFPPQMVQAYKNKTAIDVLIVTEGEKKAFVAAKNGFDCVGVSGIWNFCESSESEEDKTQGGLLPALKEFIKVCQVKKVVLLHDSDALDISTNKKKALTDRPNNFFKSTKRFAELIFQEGVQFFYSYINPNLGENKYGLDDLIKDFETYDQQVLLSFHESVTSNKYTTYFNTRQIQYIKETFIKDIFHLNDATEFYKYHKAKLKGAETFRFFSQLYKINHTEDKIEEIKQSDVKAVWAVDGMYRAATQQGSKIVSNFVMNVLFLLKSNDNPKRIVEFKNILGQTFVAELSMDDLTSVGSFRKKLIGYGSFIFKGDILELLNLSEMLFREERVATELTSLGWQKHYGFFAFSNGITSEGKFFPVDEYGIVTHHEDRFYLPAFSGLYTNADEAYENERKFRHIQNTVETTFEEWSELFYKTYKNNGAIAICFGVATLFRDIIFGELKMFPLLNLFGQKGSGKSTVAESLLNLFGVPQSAMSLENASSTKKGMYRKFSQVRNGIVWLDEYKNSINPDIIGLLKNLWDAIGYERAQTSQDNKTHSAPVLSSTIISGQDMPTIDPALFTRVILLMFKNNSFEEGDRVFYDALKVMERKGLTNITILLLAQRALINEGFAVEFKKWFAKLALEFKYDDVPDRMLKHLAVIIAPVNILVEKQIIKLPFSINELYAKCIDVLKQHKTLLNDNQEISVFWDVVETLFDEKVLSFENGDFKFVTSKTGSQDCIAIRFNRVVAAYSEKYRRMHGRNGLDKLTLTNYLKNSPAFIEIKDSVRFENNVSSAYVFNYKALGVNLERTASPESKTQASTEKIEESNKPIVEGDDNKDLPF